VTDCAKTRNYYFSFYSIRTGDTACNRQTALNCASFFYFPRLLGDKSTFAQLAQIAFSRLFSARKTNQGGATGGDRGDRRDGRRMEIKKAPCSESKGLDGR